MQTIRAVFRPLGRILWTGLFAVLFTAIVSALWSGLLLANLRLSPALPWSVAVMAILLGGLMSFLAGVWGARRSRPARRALLRLRAVPFATFLRAVIAGLCAIVALCGLWIILVQLGGMAGNKSDLSQFPPLTVAAALAMAAIAGAVSEEAGFRGYFQGTLERYMPAWLAIGVAALAMLPEHGATQGFALPTIVFYLLVDAMLGVTAWLTQSILPGIVVHAIGLAIFFGAIWPYDPYRPSVAVHGVDVWFALHAAQAAAFGALAIFAYRSLARRSKPPSRGDAAAAPAPRTRRDQIATAA